MLKRKVRIGVLETGRPPDSLVSEFQDYPHMVAEWLRAIDAIFVNYAVLDGEFPEKSTDCDLWVVTGSKFGVNEDYDWIARLEVLIREIAEVGGFIFGICFGHQIVAKALGGKVEKSAKGWGLGVHNYRVSDWPEGLGETPTMLRMQAYHQDQVTIAPSGAQCISHSEFCETAALWYPGFAFTVQGHPEFSKSYARALIQDRRGTILPEDDAITALCRVSAKTNMDKLALGVSKIVAKYQLSLEGQG